MLFVRHVWPVPPTSVRHGAPAQKLFLRLVTGPGAKIVLSFCYARPVPPTSVRHGPPAEKLFLILVTGPGAANVLISHHVRPAPPFPVGHGPLAEKLFLTLVAGLGAANVPIFVMCAPSPAHTCVTARRRGNCFSPLSFGGWCWCCKIREPKTVLRAINNSQTNERCTAFLLD